MYWSRSQKGRWMGKQKKSDSFNVEDDVKQSGKLAPFIFTVYVNDVTVFAVWVDCKGKVCGAILERV